MKKLLLIILYVTLFNNNLLAQTNYKIHTIFIYKFTQYIQWSNHQDDFVIGVIGNSPIITELQSLTNTKKVGNKNIVVKKITKSSDINNVNLIFLSESSSKDITTLLTKISNKEILIVSESNGLAKKGSGINFIIQDDKLKFELNKKNIEKQGLKVSGDLIKLAILIN